MDEQLAERAAELPDPDRKSAWRRSHRDYSPEVEMLSALFDRLGELVRVTAAVRGAKSGQPSAAPRPEYAALRVRKRIQIENHRRLVERMKPKKPAG